MPTLRPLLLLALAAWALSPLPALATARLDCAAKTRSVDLYATALAGRANGTHLIDFEGTLKLRGGPRVGALELVQSWVVDDDIDLLMRGTASGRGGGEVTVLVRATLKDGEEPDARGRFTVTLPGRRAPLGGRVSCTLG